MGKYDGALGLVRLAAPESAKVTISPGGIARWAASKTPAILGGSLADFAHDWGVQRWPNSPRGVDFVGGAFVTVLAFAAQTAGGKFLPGSERLIDKMTDGMMGRIGPLVLKVLKSWALQVKDRVASPGKAGTADPGKGGTPKPDAAKPADPGKADTAKPGNASVDNDEQAIREIGQMMSDSPETLSAFAGAVVQKMASEGADVNAAGKAALQDSLRKVAADMAAGKLKL
jgi:hypothetical protein